MDSPDSAPSRQGEVLAGKYQLGKRLGAGGMGEVYRARDLKGGRIVAIKVMHAQLATQADLVTRFLREARAANLVKHPNIVEVIEVGQAETGAPFIVQEFLEGEDLSKYLENRGGRLDEDDLGRLMLPVIDAVGAAHARGVVHRDLKPENVFLARVGESTVPKVLDFGISKIIEPTDARLTTTGTAMGTPLYMSPEQVRGERGLDARSDVWSLGVMIYEVVAGVPPFDDETQGGLFVKICTEDPLPLAERVRGVSPAFARIVDRCLRKLPADRFDEAREIAIALRGAAASGKLLPRGAAAGRAAIPDPTGPAEAPTMEAPAARSPVVRSPTARIDPDPTRAPRGERSPRGYTPQVRHVERARPGLTPGTVVATAASLAGAVAVAAFAAHGATAIDLGERVFYSWSAYPQMFAVLGLGLLGTALAWAAYRAAPPSVGLALAAIGCFATAKAFVPDVLTHLAGHLPGPLWSSSHPSWWLPLSAAAIPAGFALYNLRRARDVWSDPYSNRVTTGFYVGIALITASLAAICVKGRAPVPTDEAAVSEADAADTAGDSVSPGEPSRERHRRR